jgi:hypothetical protein
MAPLELRFFFLAHGARRVAGHSLRRIWQGWTLFQMYDAVADGTYHCAGTVMDIKLHEQTL